MYLSMMTECEGHWCGTNIMETENMEDILPEKYAGILVERYADGSRIL